MYRDIAWLLHLKSNAPRSDRTSRPGMTIDECIDQHEGIERDIEHVELFIIRGALGGLSAIQKMLNIIVFPVLLCIEGKLIYLGLFLAIYEFLYLLHASLILPLAERHFSRRGITFLRYIAISCQIIAWLLYLIIYRAKGPFEVLWLIQILFGFSSLLQLQLLDGEATSKCTDVESCRDRPDSNDENVVSDLGLLHYLTILGPCVGILVSIAVKINKDQRLSKSDITGIIPIGILGVMMAVMSLFLAIYTSFYLSSTEDRRQSIMAVIDVSQARQYNKMRSQRNLLYAGTGLFFFVFEGSIWTIFSFRSDISLFDAYIPFLIGAIVAYVSLLECWCWRSPLLVSSISRYRCFTQIGEYISSHFGAIVLLVACTLQVIMVTITYSQIHSPGGIYHPILYAFVFLLGISGAFVLPSMETKMLNLWFTRVHHDRLSTSNYSQHDYTRMAVLKMNLRRMNIVCAVGRCTGLLFAGTIVGVQITAAPTNVHSRSDV